MEYIYSYWIRNIGHKLATSQDGFEFDILENVPKLSGFSTLCLLKHVTLYLFTTFM